MKTSPLQLETPVYPVVELRAFPHDDEGVLSRTLPVDVECSVILDSDGRHFAMVSIEQKDRAFAYTFNIRVFAPFRIDVDACKESYKSAFNPAVVAVNVSRILYSGARELLATVSSRAPHGAAVLPSQIIEPKDVEISFEDNKRDQILKEYFCFTDEMLQELDVAMKAKDQAIASSRTKMRGKAVARARKSKS